MLRGYAQRWTPKKIQCLLLHAATWIMVREQAKPGTHKKKRLLVWSVTPNSTIEREMLSTFKSLPLRQCPDITQSSRLPREDATKQLDHVNVGNAHRTTGYVKLGSLPRHVPKQNRHSSVNNTHRVRKALGSQSGRVGAHKARYRGQCPQLITPTYTMPRDYQTSGDTKKLLNHVNMDNANRLRQAPRSQGESTNIYFVCIYITRHRGRSPPGA